MHKSGRRHGGHEGVIEPWTGDFAAEPGVQEAIRAEVEQLRETGQPGTGGIEVASGRLLARIYENRNFEPA